jgi:uncharacterized protein
VALILRAAARVAVPWKNGGGLTREVAVHPAGSSFDEFDWRVSLAEIHAAGPFSSFPGVERQMAVLAGQLALAIEGRAALTLSPDSPPLGFSGEARVNAQPLSPAVTDLNVMTRRSRCHARLTRRLVHTAQQLTLRADATVLIALSGLTLRSPAVEGTLSMLDALVCEGDTRCEVIPHPVGAGEGVSFYLAEITAAHP